MSQAIFRSTSQAVHFAFMIQAYEVGAESMMSKALRRMMAELGIAEGFSTEESTVDFSGLSMLEVRAQCTMIRAAVNDRLPVPEANAIQASYEPNEIIVADGQRKFVFSRARYDAILRLSDWLAPSFPDIDKMPIDLMVARAVDRQVIDCSIRDISTRFNLSKSTCGRTLGIIRRRIHTLVNLGIERLEPGFLDDFLVADCKPTYS